MAGQMPVIVVPGGECAVANHDRRHGFATSEAPIQIAEDNSAAIAQATGGIRHVRNAKHYEIRLHFLQQLVVDKSIEFKYCPTELQLADLMTKPLDAMKHKGFAEAILSYAI